MVTLDLTSEDRSGLKYKISKFPDGQQDVTITGRKLSSTWIGDWSGQAIKIVSRLNSFKDLELIICATKALKRYGTKEIHLYIPYILGARSDRQFVEGGTSYLVDIIAPILNAQNYESIECLDVHSDIALACINGLKSKSNKDLVRFALHDLYGPNTEDNFVLVSPDGGALKKIYHLADEIGFKDEIICCSKFRDTDGKLTKVHVPVRVDHFSKDIIIVDDICDGGRTFINISNEFKLAQPERTGKRYLIVTHGIFSAGWGGLMDSFDKIYTTNSYSNYLKGGLPSREVKWIEDNVKQLNVF